MHITSLQGGGVSENIEEYADSFMKINESTQTFVFEVTKDDTVIFSGIGTYTHANGTYTFTFADCFYEGTTHTAYLAEGKTLNYSTIDGQICINDPDGKPYYFS
jgi:hypothetical protein